MQNHRNSLSSDYLSRTHFNDINIITVIIIIIIIIIIITIMNSLQ